MSKQTKTTNQTQAGQADKSRLLHKLWAQPVSDWLTYLQTLGVQHATAAGTKIKLCCPFHPDTNPSAYIDTQAGFFKCYSGSCNKYVRDPVLFVKKIIGKSYEEALSSIRKGLGATQAFRKEDIDLLDATQQEKECFRLAAEVLHDYLLSIWMADAVPETAKRTRDWLKQSRHIKDVSTLTSLGMLPRESDLKRLLLAKGAMPEDVERIRKFFGSYLSTAYADCVVYTYALSPEHVSAFKLRRPEPDKDSVRTLKVNEDAPDIGVFGLLHTAYYPLIGNERVKRVFVVEGEHDQLSLHQAQLQNSVDEIIIAAGGSGHNGLEFLKGLGIDQAFIIGDHDAAGAEFPAGLMKKTDKGTSFRIFDWPKSIQAKPEGKIDPDDAVKVHGGAKVLAEILDEKNYQHAPKWALDRATHALEEVSDDDVMRHEAVGIEWGALLKNDSELSLYVQDFCTIYTSISAIQIKHAVQRNSLTISNLHLHIAKALEQFIKPVARDSQHNTLTVYVKEDHTCKELDMSTGACIKTLSTIMPQASHLYTWVESNVGIPEELPPYSFNKAAQLDTQISKSMQSALHAMGNYTQESNQMQILGQGIHFKENCVYVVCGNRVFKCMSGSRAILEAPVDGRYRFDIDTSTNANSYSDWLDSFDLASNPKPTYTREQCVEHVKDIFNQVCTFEDQENDVLYVTLMVFYSYLSGCMKEKVVTHLQGEFASGKSTLLGLLAKHDQARGYSLTHCAYSMDSTTPAGLFYAMQNTQMLLGLDEINDNNDGGSRSERVNLMVELLRGLPTKGFADRNLTDVATRRSIKQIITNPIILAGATDFRDVMDESRVCRISMVKQTKKVSSRDVLREIGDLDFYKNLRDSIMLHSLDMAVEVAAAFLDIHKAYVDEYGNTMPVTRQVENLRPLAAIAVVLGEDANKFLKKFTLARSSISLSEANTLHGALLNILMNTSFLEVKTGDDAHTKSVAALLQTDNGEHMNIQKGVFFFAADRLLVVNWSILKEEIDFSTLPQKGMAPSKLKRTADKNKEALKESDPRYEIAIKASRYRPSESKSVIDVSSWCELP